MLYDRRLVVSGIAAVAIWLFAMAMLMQPWVLTQLPALAILLLLLWQGHAGFAVVGTAMALLWTVAMTALQWPSITAAGAFLSNNLCKTEDCTVQGWLSALSGWAGFVAAAITLWALLKQITEANRHQRENLELEIAGRLAIARRTSNVCITLRSDLRHFLNFAEMTKYPTEKLIFPIRQLAQNLEADTLKRFGREIGTTDITAVDKIVARIKNLTDLLVEAEEFTGTGTSDLEHDAEVREQVILTARSTEATAAGIHDDADAFVDKWQGRTRG